MTTRTLLGWMGLLGAVAIGPVAARAADSAPRDRMILVVGAPGAPEFESQFAEWAGRWSAAARTSGLTLVTVGLSDTNGPEVLDGRDVTGGRDDASTRTDRDRFKEALDEAAREGQSRLWLVLIGHGTFDRRDARFNLRGPDMTAAELAEWLKPVDRPMAIINSAAASAPFLTALSRDRRVVIVATKSGSEQNFARFGDFLSQSILDPAADLDKDGQTSLWEAYLKASRRTAEFYSTDGRLQTEHSLLDDNGDGQGVRADDYRGLVPIVPKSETAREGLFAHQWHLVQNPADRDLPPETLQRRATLEFSVLQLRERKASLEPDDYYQQLERLLIEIAELNDTMPTAEPR